MWVGHSRKHFFVTLAAVVVMEDRRAHFRQNRLDGLNERENTKGMLTVE